MQGIDATNACCVDELAGLVRALKADYEGDCVDCYRELFNAELFSDFLQMAEYLLLDERLMQPAAVLAGGVLEEHLRKLCGKYGINASTKDAKGREVPKKVDVMNAELCKEGVYSKNDQKQVTAWCGIRNSAAHAKYDEFDDSQVEQMTQGIRSFISRYPA